MVSTAGELSCKLESGVGLELKVSVRTYCFKKGQREEGSERWGWDRGRKRKIDCPCVYKQSLRSNDNSVTMNMPSLHILVSVCHFPLKIKIKKGLLETGLIPGLDQSKYQMSLEPLLVPESREVLTEWLGTCPKDKGSSLKSQICDQKYFSIKIRIEKNHNTLNEWNKNSWVTLI